MGSCAIYPLNSKSKPHHAGPFSELVILSHNWSILPVSQSQKLCTTSPSSSSSSPFPGSSVGDGPGRSTATDLDEDVLVVAAGVVVEMGFTRIGLVDSVMEVTEDAGAGELVASTGSGGVSSPVSGDLCTPIGSRGRRSVPLFGIGVKPTESQRML